MQSGHTVLTSVWPRLQVMSQCVQSTTHAQCTSTSCSTSCVCHSVGALVCWVFFLFAGPSFSVAGVSMASMPPPSADTQPASVPDTPGKFHTILCTSVLLEAATAVGLPPSGGPVYCEGVAAGGYLHSPAGDYLHSPASGYLHLPTGVSPRSSPPAKHPGCTVHVHSLLLPRVLGAALLASTAAVLRSVAEFCLSGLHPPHP